MAERFKRRDELLAHDLANGVERLLRNHAGTRMPSLSINATQRSQHASHSQPHAR